MTLHRYQVVNQLRLIMCYRPGRILHHHSYHWAGRGWGGNRLCVKGGGDTNRRKVPSHSCAWVPVWLKASGRVDPAVCRGSFPGLKANSQLWIRFWLARFWISGVFYSQLHLLFYCLDTPPSCQAVSPSGTSFHPHTGHLELCQSDHWDRAHISYEEPFLSFLSVVAQLQKSPVFFFKSIPFQNDGEPCALGNIQCHRHLQKFKKKKKVFTLSFQGCFYSVVISVFFLQHVTFEKIWKLYKVKL